MVFHLGVQAVEGPIEMCIHIKHCPTLGESENTALAARGERLGLEVAGLNEDMVGNGEMIRDLEAENAGLKRELQGARMKLEELKDLDTLDVSKFTSLMQSNLQVAQTLESFMKKSQIIKGHQQQGDGEKSDQ